MCRVDDFKRSRVTGGYRHLLQKALYGVVDSFASKNVLRSHRLTLSFEEGRASEQVTLIQGHFRVTLPPGKRDPRLSS